MPDWMRASGRGGSVFNRTGVGPSAEPVLTPRLVADQIADYVFRVTHQVLTVEDREVITGMVMQVQEPLILTLAALGLRADEQGDIVARTWAAEAIDVARGRK